MSCDMSKRGLWECKLQTRGFEQNGNHGMVHLKHRLTGARSLGNIQAPMLLLT